MRGTEHFTEVNEVVGRLAPTDANAAVGEHATPWISASDFHHFFVEVQLGQAAVGAGLTVSVYEATDEDGSDEQIIADLSPDALVAGDQGGIVGIEIRPWDLSVNTDYTHFQVRINVAVDTYVSSVLVWGTAPTYPPVGTSEFTEIVST